MPREHPTRRRLLRTGGALAAAVVAPTGAGAVVATPGNKEFGRVYANDDLWRTNVVNTLDEEPDPNDDIYFLHDGTRPVVANENASSAQASPFVSESAPGDRDWNGGQWVHYSAEVTDVSAFNDDAPLDATDEFVGDDPTASTKDYIEIAKGRPTKTNEEGEDVPFGPPNFFVCPLNGRA